MNEQKIVVGNKESLSEQKLWKSDADDYKNKTEKLKAENKLCPMTFSAYKEPLKLKYDSGTLQNVRVKIEDNRVCAEEQCAWWIGGCAIPRLASDLSDLNTEQRMINDMLMQMSGGKTE